MRGRETGGSETNLDPFVCYYNNNDNDNNIFTGLPSDCRAALVTRARVVRQIRSRVFTRLNANNPRALLLLLSLRLCCSINVEKRRRARQTYPPGPQTRFAPYSPPLAPVSRTCPTPPPTVRDPISVDRATAKRSPQSYKRYSLLSRIKFYF